MKRTTIDFGIDLGTTNSTIAVIDEIDAKVIPNKVGSGITPSAFWIDKRGNEQLGEEAKLRALEDPRNGDLEFKLRMGSGEAGKKHFARSGRTMLPEELSAEVLKSLKRDVQTSMGEDVKAAVITVPAAFENSQTNATRKAAELAGLGLSPLLLEPVAASLAYGFQSESENVYWFVYDFGGGTFDAAVMRIRDGLIQVVNHDGDNFLGGKLIDWDIVTAKLIPALAKQFNVPDFRRGNERWESAIGKLKWHAEKAKIEVCRTKAPFELWVENLCEDADGKPIDFAYTLTPGDIQSVSQPHIEKSIGLCRQTLKKTGLNGANMERILMVGGSTLNPWVREAVLAELGGKLEFGIDPVTVVARGAAIFASTQSLPSHIVGGGPLKEGTWLIDIEHKPVGNVADPDIGGRIIAPGGQSLEGFTIELVDTKHKWRSGRIRLGAEGVFMTQLYAEKQKRHEYEIELCDVTGTRIPTEPDRVAYTLGVIPEENPPAVHTIGVGLSNGGVATYVVKGTKLPFRKAMDHYTTREIRAGHEEDELRIPLIEGEHPRADRNHGIGVMVIKGTDIKRDLPAGSQVEIALMMDASQQIRLHVLVTAFDEDFEKKFDSVMSRNTQAQLVEEIQLQKARLAAAREKAQRTGANGAAAEIARIEDEQMIPQVEQLGGAAESDQDAAGQLDRRLRDLAAAIDKVEDAAEWPVLVEKAQESQADTEKVVKAHGTATDQSQFALMKKDLQQAIDAKDPDLVRSVTSELDGLYFEVLDRQPGYHTGRFNWLAEQLSKMNNQSQAEQLIAAGRRAINNNDIDALKATNRQLTTLLPKTVKQEGRHKTEGDTQTHN